MFYVVRSIATPVPSSAVKSSLVNPAMDTTRTPIKELLAIIGTVTDTEFEIAFFGGFPKVDFYAAEKEARRRWDLARRFNQALWLWSPGKAETPREIAKLAGVADPQEAEESWLEAVWLWPDTEQQEHASEKFWGMNENVAEAQGRLDELQHASVVANVNWRKEKSRKAKAVLAEKKKKTEDAFARAAPRLRLRAQIVLQPLHPELWVRWAILSARDAKDKSYQRRWRDDIRVQLGRMIPAASGRQLDYDAALVLLVFSQCYQWLKRQGKNLDSVKPYVEYSPGSLRVARSRAERACLLAEHVLRAANYKRAPLAKQISKIVASSKFLTNLREAHKSR
ncbi:MAG: hypothetical protein ACREQ5_10345 [Candidatus Dormibacteria bacterium]